MAKARAAQAGALLPATMQRRKSARPQLDTADVAFAAHVATVYGWNRYASCSRKAGNALHAI